MSWVEVFAKIYFVRGWNILSFFVWVNLCYLYNLSTLIIMYAYFVFIFQSKWWDVRWYICWQIKILYILKPLIRRLVFYFYNTSPRSMYFILDWLQTMLHTSTLSDNTLLSLLFDYMLGAKSSHLDLAPPPPYATNKLNWVSIYYIVQKTYQHSMEIWYYFFK